MLFSPKFECHFGVTRNIEAKRHQLRFPAHDRHQHLGRTEVDLLVRPADHFPIRHHDLFVIRSSVGALVFQLAIPLHLCCHQKPAVEPFWEERLGLKEMFEAGGLPGRHGST